MENILYTKSKSPLLEASFRPSLLYRIDSTLSLNSNKTLDQFLNEKSAPTSFVSEVPDSQLLNTSSFACSPGHYQSSGSPKFKEHWQQLLENETILKSQWEQKSMLLEAEVDDLLRRNASLQNTCEETLRNAQSELKEKQAEINSLDLYLQEKDEKIKILNRKIIEMASESRYFEEKENKNTDCQALRERIENLTLELQSRPTQKQYKQLASQLQSIKQDSRSRSATSIRNKTLKTQPSNELFGKLSKLVKQCSPIDNFQPTHKQVWNWVHRIMNEHYRQKIVLADIAKVVGGGETELLERISKKNALLSKVKEFFKVRDDRELERKLFIN